MTLTEWMGIASTIGLGVIGFLKFLAAQRVDAVSAQSGIASTHQAGVEQLIKGSNELIDQLQEENKRLLAFASERSTRLDSMTMEVARLRRKYGNGDSDVPAAPVTPVT